MEKRGPVASARTAVLAIIIVALGTILAQAALLFGLERFNTQVAARLDVNREQVRRVEQIATDVQRLNDVPSDRRTAQNLRAQADALPQVTQQTQQTTALNDVLLGTLDSRLTAPWFASEARYRDDVRAFLARPRDVRRLELVLNEYERARVTLQAVVSARAELARERSRWFVEALAAVLAASVLCCAAGWWFVFVPVERREALALRRLNESRRRFQALFEFNPDAVFSLDSDGRIARANGACAALLSAKVESLAGERLGDYIFDDGRHGFAFAFDRALKGRSSEFDARVHAPDATTRDVIVTLCPIWIENAVAGVYAIAKDVTDVRSAEAALFKSERRFRSLFEQSGEGVAALGLDGTIRRVNAELERLTGYAGEELIGASPAMLVPPEDIALVGERVRAALAACETQQYEYVMIRKDGARRVVIVKTIPIVNDGETDGLYAIMSDVTDQRELERGSREQARRIRELYLLAASSASAGKQIDRTMVFGAHSLRMDSAQVLQDLGDGTYVVHSALQGGLVKAGDTLARGEILAPYVTFSGYPVIIEDVRNSEWRNHPISGKYAVRSFVGATIRLGGKPWGVLSFNSREAARPLTSTDGDFVQLMAALIGTAIERDNHHQYLNTMAFYDALTGLPNRSLFAEHAAAALARARRDGTKVAVHYVDVDGFKSVNDSFGHGAGDELLRIVAKRFGATLRESDVVARLSGDEFAYLQTGLRDPSDAVALAHRVVEAIDEPFLLTEGVARVSASIGISIAPENGDDLELLLKKADAALYAVKAGGKRGARLYAGEGHAG